MSHKTFGELNQDLPDEFYPGPIGVRTPESDPTDYLPQYQIEDGPDVIAQELNEDIPSILGGVPAEELADELDKSASGVADEIGGGDATVGGDDEREDLEGGGRGRS